MSLTALEPLIDKWTGSPTSFKMLARDVGIHECVDAPSNRTEVLRLVVCENQPIATIGTVFLVILCDFPTPQRHEWKLD